MYEIRIFTNQMTSETIEVVSRKLDAEVTETFSNIESNDGPERRAYLAWLAEGNQPRVIDA